MELKKKVAGVGAGVLAAAGIVYLKGGGGLKKFETFESAEGRFSVSMPGEPVKIIETVDSFVEDITFTMFAADSTKFGFVVGYCDYPEEVLIDADPDTVKILGRLIEAVVEKVAGKLVKEAILENYGDAAIEYRVDVPEKGILTSRLIMDGSRLYQLIAMFPEDGQDEKKMAEFFDSFKINEE